MTDDPFESAENPQMRAPGYWGQVQLDMFYAVLEKGTGKVPFNPQVHSADKRVTAIDITIQPIADQNIQYPVTRGMIAESKEWAGIVLPSIKALNITVRELNGKWIYARAKPTGTTYVNKQGETKDRTTLEFVKLFKDESECKADYLTAGGQAAPVQQEEPPFEPTNALPGGDTKEKQTALQFLKVVIQNACRGQADLQAARSMVSTNIASMPVISKFFTVDSPETMQLMAEAMK
jgi:hypothetical protein